MKFVIIGLGNFGSSLAINLTQNGHEVIGVDSKMSKVDMFKEKISHTICLDSRDEQTASQLPMKDTDIVVVCIGEDEGANIMATALMKKLKAKRLISRAVSPLHQNVLEAMGIDEIIHPEEETADRWTQKLTMRGVVDSFVISSEYSIIEATVPETCVGKNLEEIGIRRNYEIIVMTTIKPELKENILGINRKTKRVQGVASSKTILEDGDIMVMYGKINDIKKFLKHNQKE
ncbi:MAG: TrkA family potassium uptake protein [Bacteroidales bacterium]|nr:TrkA family potassium uptake protein [Bacteroidales bacterium]